MKAEAGERHDQRRWSEMVERCFKKAMMGETRPWKGQTPTDCKINKALDQPLVQPRLSRCRGKRLDLRETTHLSNTAFKVM